MGQPLAAPITGAPIRSRRSRHLAFGILFACLLAGTAVIAQAQASAQVPETRVVVGFAEAQSDDLVAAFIARNGLQAQALYLASNGLYGTHRAYRPDSTADIVASARAETVVSLTRTLNGNLVRLAKFIDEHGAQDVIASAELQQQARSLLTVRAQAEAVIAATRRGADLIYAIEVRAPTPQQLETVTRDPAVVAVQKQDGTGALRARPASLDMVFSDPVVEARDARATREVMLKLIREGSSAR